MIDPDLLAIGYLVVKALTTGRHEQNTSKIARGISEIRRDLKAIKFHLGIEVGADGRVIELKRDAASGAHYAEASEQ